MKKEMSKKDYEKSFEKFNQAMDNILIADSNSYSTKVKELVHLIESNYILYDFMKPSLDSSITVEEVTPELGVFKLPDTSDDQIAVMFKFFYRTNYTKSNQLNLDINYAFAHSGGNYDDKFRFFNRMLV